MMHTNLFILLWLICAFWGSTNAQTGSFMHDGQLRSYIVHLPPAFSDQDTLPLVLNLHGLTDNAQGQTNLSQINPVADRERFIVVAPNGLNNSWNVFGIPYFSGVDDVGFLSALIDTISKNYHIDLSRVYSTGMSNGGFMSYRLACELNNRIAAIASVTGSMTDSMLHYCNPVRPVPVLHFHGTSDQIVNYNGVLGTIISVENALQAWVQFNGCPSTVQTTAVPDIDMTDNTTAEKYYWGTCNNSSEVIHYKILGGGHTWPGRGGNGILGNSNKDIDASELIWEFFSKYDLNGKMVTQLVEPDLPEEQLSVYPNPASDFVTINISPSSSGRVWLTDLSGRLVVELLHEFKKTSIKLDLSNVREGMYLLFFENQVTKIMRINQ